MLQPKPMRAPQPISRPPMPAARSDLTGGHAVAAKGLLAAAAAMAPNSMPKSVRLDVSDRTESERARLGPGHCQNAALRQVKTKRSCGFRAPDRVAECDAPGMAAGDKHGNAQQANGESADDVISRRHVVRAARTRDRNNDRRRRGEAGERNRQAAPGAEIVGRQHGIHAAERQESRQRETAEHAADHKKQQRDQHASRAAADRIERAGTATVGELHADAEHKGADHQRGSERRDGSADTSSVNAATGTTASAHIAITIKPPSRPPASPRVRNRRQAAVKLNSALRKATPSPKPPRINAAEAGWLIEQHKRDQDGGRAERKPEEKAVDAERPRPDRTRPNCTRRHAKLLETCAQIRNRGQGLLFQIVPFRARGFNWPACIAGPLDHRAGIEPALLCGQAIRA